MSSNQHTINFCSTCGYGFPLPNCNFCNNCGAQQVRSRQQQPKPMQQQQQMQQPRQQQQMQQPRQQQQQMQQQMQQPRQQQQMQQQQPRQEQPKQPKKQRPCGRCKSEPRAGTYAWCQTCYDKETIAIEGEAKCNLCIRKAYINKETGEPSDLCVKHYNESVKSQTQ